MSSESDIKSTQTPWLTVERVGLGSELVVTFEGMPEEAAIVVSEDEFANDGGQDHDRHAPTVWSMFNEAHVFYHVFEVKMIFTDKKVMSATIKLID